MSKWERFREEYRDLDWVLGAIFGGLLLGAPMWLLMLGLI